MKNNICTAAASKGHLKILRYAHENGSRLDESICKEAARNCHFEILKYAHENGCPLGGHVASYALMKRDSYFSTPAEKQAAEEILKYASDNEGRRT